jgi:hypothetical protein
MTVKYFKEATVYKKAFACNYIIVQQEKLLLQTGEVGKLLHHDYKF